MSVAGVPHETSASRVPAKRKYHSPARRKVAEQKRTALIAAVIVLARQGNFRGTAAEIATLACVRRQSLGRYFGSVELLYRVVAREHWQQILPCLPFDADRQKDAIWALLVGKPRELS
jgi:AcrR family transcriptional regulator